MLRPKVRYRLAAFALLLPALAAATGARGDMPTRDRRPDAVVLVADVRTGRSMYEANAAEAHRRAYAPGSIFKLAIALAAIESGSFDPRATTRCTGSLAIGGTRYRCWTRRGHGDVGLTRALASSCNIYFASLARRLPREAILDAARRLGMLPRNGPAGELTDSTLFGEEFRISPSELLGTALTLATRGRLGAGGAPLLNARYAPLFDGLAESVRNGTAREAWLRRAPGAGKTGTTADPSRPGRTVGWFIGYAPARSPRYAIVVMLPNSHGSDAAALAGRVLRRLP